MTTVKLKAIEETINYIANYLLENNNNYVKYIYIHNDLFCVLKNSKFLKYDNGKVFYYEVNINKHNFSVKQYFTVLFGTYVKNKISINESYNYKEFDILTDEERTIKHIIE